MSLQQRSAHNPGT
uniref:Uncharacterized protein n=1 Tax=Moniliophthora roreri TaxID=221103 RepID=A0A0W0GBV9_MONRR